MSKKKNDDILIDFSNSESSEGVTGSCVYIKTPEKNILIECGLAQGGSLLETYRKNSKQFKFKVKDLDYVFVNHLHADHQNLVPLLVKRGCKAEIIVPIGSKQIMLPMLLNSAMILNGEAEVLSKKLEKIVEPIYTKEDVYKCMEYIVEFPLYDEIELDENTKFKFISSGHIIDSASLLLKLKKGNNWKTVYYTSDLGNIRQKSYFVNNMDKVKNCDICISEATYADKSKSCSNKDQREKDLEKIKSVVDQYCIQQKGKVLIPTFSLHRGQIFAYILYHLFKDKEGFKIPIYMDSMLLNEITDIFKKRFPEFAEVMQSGMIQQIDKGMRSGLMQSKEPMIILASSGFFSGGASVPWLQSMIENPKNCLLFCGYSGEVGSLGWKLKQREKVQKTITLSGKSYRNRINVVSLKSFSGHIQHDDLVEYLSSINCQTVLLHHGDTLDRIVLKDILEKNYEKKCQTTSVKVVNKSTQIHL